MSRLFLVAGEASGDLQGGLLAEALLAKEPSIRLEGVGGEAMERAGVALFRRSEEMGVTGFFEVIRHLPRLVRLLNEVSRRIVATRPDAAILIDYPDFNLRLAARLRRHGVKVIYYISPQVWAWRGGRVGAIRRTVDRMIVIFPFEEPLYRDAGVPVRFVGHPLVDRVRATRSRDRVRSSLGLLEGEKLVVLLPGSRHSEIARIAPVLDSARRMLARRPEIRWAVALAPGLTAADLPPSMREDPSLPLRAGETYDLLGACDLAVVASGTATLEGALLGAPMIVVYKMHPISWAIARRLVRVQHVAMANLVLGKRIVPELIQDEANPKRVAAEIVRILDDPALLRVTREALRQAAQSLGSGGAAVRAADAVLDAIAS